MLNIERFQSKEDVIVEGQRALEDFLRDSKNKKEKVLLCLSGGSALELLNGFDFSVIGENVTLTVLDERFSTNSAINNLSQIDKIGFLDKAREVGCQVIDTRVKEGETMDEVVVGFNMALVRWQENNPIGKIVATAGMGPDGHTSGIIPQSRNFGELFMHDSGKYVVGYTAANQPEDRNQRVTTNFDFLKLVAFAVLVVMGDEKKSAVTRLLANQGSLTETPARIWRETRGMATMFTNLQLV